MKVTKKSVAIRDLFQGFSDKQEQGVVGYSGALNIRPAYQREFIYKQEQQIAVIRSILAGMPLSCMYWAVNDDGTFEVLDGQQRTMSICRFLSGAFSVGYDFFDDFSEEDKNKILDYELDVYFCEGSEKDKIRWFEIINIAGEKLTNQELRNAIFTGPWVLDAKRYFSRVGCPAAAISDGYVKGSTTRQELLELAIEWASDGKVDEYMSQHRRESNALQLWNHFSEVISWVRSTFPTQRPRLMVGVNWGKLYKEYQSSKLNPAQLEQRFEELLLDEEVTNHKGIYTYLLSGEEKHLSIRTFPEAMKRKMFARQGGICPLCNERHPLSGMEADHIVPWSQGGKTTEENCQMLCKKCNRTKSNK